MAILKTTFLSKIATVDIINICLIVISFIVALKIPFSLFLLAYAILGPLHYLTEIFWLDKQSYYLINKKDFRWLVIIGVIATGLMLSKYIPALAQTGFLKYHKSTLFNGLIFLSLILSIVYTLFKNTVHRIIAFTISCIIAYGIYKTQVYIAIFSLFIFTIIHVCFFTALFMLYGAMKNRSKVSYLALLVYIICILLYLIIPIQTNSYTISTLEQTAMINGGFLRLNAAISAILNGVKPNHYSLLSDTAIRIQCFIAFVYTYHYLNWFSKVEIIKWNKVTVKVKVITFIVWLIAISLYAYNYTLGILSVFILSLLHVLLEFPLNIISIKGIITLLVKRK